MAVVIELCGRGACSCWQSARLSPGSNVCLDESEDCGSPCKARCYSPPPPARPKGLHGYTAITLTDAVHLHTYVTTSKKVSAQVFVFVTGGGEGGGSHRLATHNSVNKPNC